MLLRHFSAKCTYYIQPRWRLYLLWFSRYKGCKKRLSGRVGRESGISCHLSKFTVFLTGLTPKRLKLECSYFEVMEIYTRWCYVPSMKSVMHSHAWFSCMSKSRFWRFWSIWLIFYTICSGKKFFFEFWNLTVGVILL